ncbi:hypothetical protein [Candidatus Solirubrobacter pratensis]|uniref:hypothetical protein n=1 Tax=Candidatus Solirubrobacter pratensis TaxID=1298857 RepID=UPI0012DFBE6D|nr:hypothetical protein [Candidatus Solirubrobacter pratensis]
MAGSGRLRARFALTSCAVALALCGPGVALARADTPIAEPNDNIVQAFGPLSPGETYSGSLDSPNDVDRLLLYVNGAKQIDIAVTKVGAGCSGSLDAELRNGDGGYIGSGSPSSDGTAHIGVGAPGAGILLLTLTGTCAGNPYQVVAGPADAITTVPSGPIPRPSASPNSTAEPNDDVAHASAPVAAMQWYGGEMASPNDVDMYAIDVNGAKQIDVAVAKVGAGCNGTVDAELRNADGGYIGSASPSSDTFAQIQATTAAAGRIYLKVSGTCAGNAYEVLAGPADAIGGNTGGRDGPSVKPRVFGPGGIVVSPSNRRCLSRRNFRIRIRNIHGVTVAAAAVFVNGRRVRLIRGRRLRAPVDLRGLPKGRYTVRIRVFTTDGRTLTGQRKYRTCSPRRPGGSPPL